MDIYVVTTHDDGIVGAGATVELAKRVAEGRFDDYFGRPIRWQTDTIGQYHESAHVVTLIFVELVTVRED